MNRQVIFERVINYSIIATDLIWTYLLNTNHKFDFNAICNKRASIIRQKHMEGNLTLCQRSVTEKLTISTVAI